MTESRRRPWRRQKRRVVSMTFCFDPAEADHIRTRAAALDMPMSQFVRLLLNRDRAEQQQRLLEAVA